MRRAIEASLLVLTFSILNIGFSMTGFAQDEAGQENIIKKSVRPGFRVLHRAR